MEALLLAQLLLQHLAQAIEAPASADRPPHRLEHLDQTHGELALGDVDVVVEDVVEVLVEVEVDVDVLVDVDVELLVDVDVLVDVDTVVDVDVLVDVDVDVEDDGDGHDRHAEQRDDEGEGGAGSSYHTVIDVRCSQSQT